MRSFIYTSLRASIRLSYCISFFAALLLMQGCLLNVQAAPGDLDSSFGTGGVVTTNFFSGDDIANAVVIQPDGKIVAVGYTDPQFQAYRFALARYNANGTLDDSFGTGGKVTTTSDGRGHFIANAAALQSDGKIVAAGALTNDVVTHLSSFALVRYNADGTLDSSFGTGGKVFTPIGGSNAIAQAVVIQSDGRIVAAGYKDNGGINNDFMLARYNADGSLDPTYGSNGIVITVVSNQSDTAYAVTIQPDGKIIAAGNSQINFALARYNVDGSLDNSFGTNGKVLTFIGNTSAAVAYSIALQSNGKIVAAGAASNGSSNTFALARYNTDGSLDTSFGTTGKVTTAIGIWRDDARAVAIYPNGKIVAAGYSNQGNGYRKIALTLYNADGSLDPSFGTGGIVTTSVTTSAVGFAAALQTDGKIVVAGTTTDFVLARYLGPSLTLATEANSNQAIALDSVTMQRGPFSVTNTHNFSADQRTRISLFALNVELLPSDNSSSIIVLAKDSQNRFYPVTVEYVGKVPGFDWLTQVNIKLPDELAGAGDVSLNINLHGTQSNTAVIKIQ